jgi:hypothetical protein
MTDDRTNGTPKLPDSVLRSDWMPIVLRGEKWSEYWRTCKPCPECRADLSTNGRDSWRCPRCGWKQSKSVARKAPPRRRSA